MHPSKLILLAAAVVAVSGCATKSYVDEQVAGLESKMDQRIDEWSATSRDALERAEKAGVLAEGKFLYNVVLTEDDISFSTDEATLSDSAQSRLNQLAGKLKADNKNVYLEIQGHTDSTGPDQYNRDLGLKRAESVQRYLHTQGVALDRMSTISYGEDAPAADNSTRDGRASNRRVEIVVLM